MEILQVYDKLFENGALKIKTIDGWNYVFLVNGHRLKVYVQPLTKGYFMQQVEQPFEKELVGVKHQTLEELIPSCP